MEDVEMPDLVEETAEILLSLDLDGPGLQKLDVGAPAVAVQPLVRLIHGRELIRAAPNDQHGRALERAWSVVQNTPTDPADHGDGRIGKPPQRGRGRMDQLPWEI